MSSVVQRPVWWESATGFIGTLLNAGFETEESRCHHKRIVCGKPDDLDGYEDLNMSSETLGQLRESETGYGKIWNEGGKSFFQPFIGHNEEGQIVEITQQNIDDVAAGKWRCEEHQYDNHFDGATSVGNIIWSWVLATNSSDTSNPTASWTEITDDQEVFTEGSR